MWLVLRTCFLRQVKYNCKWDPLHKAVTLVKPYYKMTSGICSFRVPENELMCDQFSSGNISNRDTGKRYDKYFYFIHQNDLYRNTTLNYNLLSKFEYKRETQNLLNKIVLPTSSIREKVQQLTDEELQQIMICLINRKISLKYKIQYHLDEECAKRALKWTVITSLYMLDGWIIIDEKFIFKGKFFTVLRNLWCHQLQHCSKENLVQIIYYLGRSKQPAPTLLSDRIEKVLLQLNNDITLNEWGIVCNGFFKMKTKIKSSKLLHHIADAANHQLKDSDKYNLISILKAFRHACYFNDSFLRFLENFTRETYRGYNVLECAHFLAMFANVGWYNREVFEALEMQVISKLVSAIEAKANGLCVFSSFNIRIKDIARILWSISHTGHKPRSENFFETMASSVKEFIDKEFSKNIHYIIDCAHSLIVMDYYCDNILDKLLRKDIFQKLKLSVKRKPLYQLYFIHSSVGIEAPLYKSGYLTEELFQNCSPLKSIYKDTRERLGVEQLITIMNRYCTEKEEFTHSFILPHIAISSICIEATVKTNSKQLPDNEMHNCSNSSSQQLKICLEVLDPTVCLGNYQHCMTGLMVGKIRQLRKLNYGVVMFTPEAVTRMTRMPTENLRLYIDNVFIKVMAESLVTIK